MRWPSSKHGTHEKNVGLKTCRKIPSGKPRYESEDNIKLNVKKERRLGNVERIRTGTSGGSL